MASNHTHHYALMKEDILKALKAQAKLSDNRMKRTDNVARYSLGIECPICGHDAVFHVKIPDAFKAAIDVDGVNINQVCAVQGFQALVGSWTCLHPDCSFGIVQCNNEPISIALKKEDSIQIHD